MEIDHEANTMTYRCTVLEDSNKIFVEIVNPAIQDIHDNHCFSFDSKHMKSQDDLRCERIRGNLNYPEYEGYVLSLTVCSEGFDDTVDEDECQTGIIMCEDLGGKVIESLSCWEHLGIGYSTEPTPCDFRGPTDCKFSE
ncbi:MAG: hypothetical protein GKS07_09865 [Nitrosopumilus sp.]|nr:MAG: hypothetical protein GKS07_09865 [Nitrosopumilus sp.]